MAKIKVVLADDHAVLRVGLKVLLNAEPDIEVIDEAADGLEAIRQVREKAPDVKTLALTINEGGEYVFRVLAAGAHGYILKKAAHTDLVEAIRAVNRGEAFLG